MMTLNELGAMKKRVMNALKTTIQIRTDVSGASEFDVVIKAFSEVDLRRIMNLIAPPQSAVPAISEASKLMWRTMYRQRLIDEMYVEGPANAEHLWHVARNLRELEQEIAKMTIPLPTTTNAMAQNQSPMPSQEQKTLNDHFADEALRRATGGTITGSLPD